MPDFPLVDTPHLAPQQAQRLAAWAGMVLARAKQRLAHLPPAEQEKYLADKETAVKLVITLCDEIIGALHEPEDEVVDERRLRLFKNLAWLTGRPAHRAHRRHIKQFKLARIAQNKDAAFHSLFQAILVGSLPDR